MTSPSSQSLPASFGVSILLSGLLLLGGCTKPAPSNQDAIAPTLRPDQAPQATEAKVPMPAIADPGPAETLYVVHLEDSAGRAVAGVMTELLSAKPEGLDIRQPRVKTRIASYRSPLHGRVHFMVQSDSEPKWFWVGGKGFDPFVVELEPALGGQRYERTVKCEILPIANFVIEDVDGNLVANAIVTMKPVDDTGKGSNMGTTMRSDDLGEVQFSRPPGTYLFLAKKPNGTCQLRKRIEWKGDPEPMVMRLPAKTPGK